MAEVAVNLVLNKLIPLLIEQSQIFKGINREVQDVKRELQRIRAFVEAADAMAERGDKDNGVKPWVQQLRDVAYHVEDVIDEYMLHAARHPHRQGMATFFHRVTDVIGGVRVSHIYSEIQEIKKSLKDIMERKSWYQLSPSEDGSSNIRQNTSWLDPRVSAHFVEESELVGIESPRDEMTSWLAKGGSNRVVLSVIGMGGIGKTALAKKVFESQLSTNKFDCHAWITVSQSYKKEDLLKSMVKQFYDARKEPVPQGFDSMELILLIESARKFLKEKRYIVVLDDVWQIEFWGSIKNALPMNDKGSRILITSRHESVALSCKESEFDHMYGLRPLPQAEAWKLFCKKAFGSESKGSCPIELEKLSLQIVKKCEGLPLAIVAISGLLSTKEKVEHEWQNLYDTLGSLLECNPHLIGITRILSLSYQDLPYYLKSCLLYFAMFPEDYCISRCRLIRLWIAEGFVEPKKGMMALEDVAEEYLMELVHRSLIQVEEVNARGKIRSCRVHDLMREFLLMKSEELSFCHVLAEKCTGSEGSARRLSIHCGKSNAVENFGNYHVRSLLLFDAENLPILKKLCANFQLLKVLDFQDAPLSHLPSVVGNLIHLKYLSMKGTRITSLPKSVGKLCNLETLDLRDTLVQELPFGIHKLRKLHYLLCFHLDDETSLRLSSHRGLKIQGKVGCVVELKKLDAVEVNTSTDLLTELGRLKMLRKLSITKLREEDGPVLCSAIENMHHLLSFSMTTLDFGQVIDLQHIASPPRNLRSIGLCGRLMGFPGWIPKLQNLAKLHLGWSGFVSDPLEVLQALPNLSDLVLLNAYECPHYYFQTKGFQRLKKLAIRQVDQLSRVTIFPGAMPLLEDLYLGSIPQLMSVPSGIQNLSNLKSLMLFNMSKSFVRDILPEEGLYYWMVKHIHTVSIVIDSEGVYEYSILSDVEKIKQMYGLTDRYNLQQLRNTLLCREDQTDVWSYRPVQLPAAATERTEGPLDLIYFT